MFSFILITDNSMLGYGRFQQICIDSSETKSETWNWNPPHCCGAIQKYEAALWLHINQMGTTMYTGVKIQNNA